LRGLAMALEMFHAAGLTSVGDTLVDAGGLELYQEAERRGQLSMRVNMLLVHERFEHLRRLGLRTGIGSHRLRLAGVKAFVDGAIAGRTCLPEEPFEGSDDHGMQTTSTAELHALVLDLHRSGSRLGVHANGDRAIALLLDAFEAAQRQAPRGDAHHRIEHCTVITPEIVARMRRLGLVAVPFGSYVAYHGAKLVDWYGERRLERMFAHRTLLDAGITVAGSSDYPCGPFEPLLAMRSCVTRQAEDGRVLGASQRISPREALALYTTGAAAAFGEAAGSRRAAKAPGRKGAGPRARRQVPDLYAASPSPSRWSGARSKGRRNVAGWKLSYDGPAGTPAAMMLNCEPSAAARAFSAAGSVRTPRQEWLWTRSSRVCTAASVSAGVKAQCPARFTNACRSRSLSPARPTAEA